MKKFAIALLALAFVAAACNKVEPNNQTTPPPPVVVTPPPPPPVTTPATQTYSNSTYGFTFEYAKELTFVTPVYASLQDKITELRISASDYPKTNFGDAAFTVSAASAKTLAACLALTPPENGDGFKTKVAINGQDFYMTKGSGAGAGNIYDSTVYRAFVGTQTCVELNETVHTGNIGNYPVGTVTELDKAAVQARLDQILKTFKFTK